MEKLNYILNFDRVYKLIRLYIKDTLNSKVQINEYVPNTHIAEVFREVLRACELEAIYPNEFHNINNDYGADKVADERLHLYYKKDNLFFKKEPQIIKLKFIDIIDDYFNAKRLKENGIDEIHKTYQRV